MQSNEEASPFDAHYLDALTHDFSDIFALNAQSNVKQEVRNHQSGDVTKPPVDFSLNKEAG